MSESWWSQEVRFLQRKPARAPKHAMPEGAKTALGIALQLVLGVTVGAIVGSFLATGFGQWILRSFVRGAIYRELNAWQPRRRR